MKPELDRAELVQALFQVVPIDGSMPGLFLLHQSKVIVAIACMVFISSAGCRAIRSKKLSRDLMNARTYSLRGADYLQKKNYSQAEPLFSEALKYSDADERAHWGLAEVLWKEKRTKEAIEHMSQAVNLSEENPEYIVRLGEMFLEVNAPEQALAQADKALTHDRKHAAAWELKGRALKQSNQLREALDSYSMAMIYRPDHARSRIAMADIYRQLGRPQMALVTLDELAEDQPTEPLPAQVWMLKSQALAALGELSESHACLAQACECVGEDEPDVMVALAKIHMASGEIGQARMSLARALRCEPGHADANMLQAELDGSFTDLARTTVAVKPTPWKQN